MSKVTIEIYGDEDEATIQVIADDPEFDMYGDAAEMNAPEKVAVIMLRLIEQYLPKMGEGVLVDVIDDEELN